MSVWRKAEPNEQCGKPVYAWGHSRPPRPCVRRATYAVDDVPYCWQHWPRFRRGVDTVADRITVLLPMGEVSFDAF